MRDLYLYGFDILENSKANPINLSIKKSGLKSVSYSLESDNSGFEETTFENPSFDVRYFFKDASAQDIDDLINGRAYLEFWLPIVNHTKLSGNAKLYTEEDIINGMEGYFKNTMETGGVPGELDHPSLKLYSDNEKSKMNFENNMDKIRKVDQKNVVWYVVAHKLHNGISYFKFRTDISNRRVVMNMLNGKAPSGSLRVTGKFSQDPQTGIWRGENVKLVTIDYVENPGFKMATLFQGAIDLIQSGTDKLKKIVFTNDKSKTNTYAFESLNDDEFKKDVENSDIYQGNSAYIVLENPGNKKERKRSLDEMLDDVSFL